MSERPLALVRKVCAASCLRLRRRSGRRERCGEPRTYCARDGVNSFDELKVANQTARGALGGVHDLTVSLVSGGDFEVVDKYVSRRGERWRTALDGEHNADLGPSGGLGAERWRPRWVVCLR